MIKLVFNVYVLTYEINKIKTREKLILSNTYFYIIYIYYNFISFKLDIDKNLIS